ncbi:MAG TPA: site-specific DNA-methyltransferase [Chitinophagales bacterium]|nr:site-specific DNA-methyltransferase [Chitinophagales bacterium]MCB9074331.1 site-specific DNA-methyltransferase [Chitinophagales bacterium]HNE85840.1 site-specific DNA-methyltransferase [Chitinophagales bacterium]HNG07956.1 site-specific DNA-methyltransferase [Chitinophagales bacterium]HNG26721.1 site-specific DNA-methyltransferase [Chitinophagales bacterium]
MQLDYPNKKTEQQIFDSIPNIFLEQINNSDSSNLLIQANNLVALKQLITQHNLAGKIDLIYIDPPFATNNTFTITDGRASTISNSKNGNVAYSDTLKGFDFIEFIRERLVLLKMLLSDKGSIYLHIDYKIGHYVKIIMDEIFGIENFRNDITRVKCNPKNFARKGYGNIKDMILFYSKSDNLIWNEPKTPYTDEDKIKLFQKTEKDGRRYTTIPLHAPGETQNGKTSQAFKGILPPKGRHWRSDVAILEQWDNDGLIEWSNNGNPRKKIYFDEQEGKRMQDIWEFKDPQYPVYPTEKNADLLDIIVKTSSNEDSIILDCFAGSGTTLKSAQTNGRKWIGIDQSEEAIKVIIAKLDRVEQDLFIDKSEYKHMTENQLNSQQGIDVNEEKVLRLKGNIISESLKLYQ